MTKIKSELAFALRVEGPSLELDVYDRIGSGGLFDEGEGVTAKSVLSKLNAAKGVKTISVRINSNGGIVDDGKAIYNLLRERSEKGARVKVQVDGIAASAASVIAMAGDEIKIAKNGFVMIHEARSLAMGTASHMAKTGVLLKRINAQLAAIYAEASARRGKNKSVDYFLEAMAEETFYDAEQAVDVGLADDTSEAVKVAASVVDISGLEHAPDALLQAPYVLADEASVLQFVQPLIDRQKSADAITLGKTETTPLDGERSESHAHRSEEEETMTPKYITALLGLSEDADETAVTAAVTDLKAEYKAAPKSVLRMLGADSETRAAAKVDELQKVAMSILGMTGASTNEQAVMQVTAWKAGNDQSVKLANRVAELEESTRVAELESTIQLLTIGDGAKLRPAQHEWARTNFSNAKSLSQWALSAPEARMMTVTEKTSAHSTTLSALEQDICRQTGVSEADYIATRNAQQAFIASRAGV